MKDVKEQFDYVTSNGRKITKEQLKHMVKVLRTSLMIYRYNPEYRARLLNELRLLRLLYAEYRKDDTIILKNVA